MPDDFQKNLLEYFQRKFKYGLVGVWAEVLIEEGRQMNPSKEPRAELRQAASEMYQLYNALMMEGFNEDQAMRIISEVLRGGMSQPKE